MPLKKNYPWNVLIWPAASEVGLEINRALGDCKEAVLHGAQQPGPSAAPFHFRLLHDLPPVTEPECLPELQALIAAHQIDAIFPAHDDVVLWLAQNAAALNATVITAEASIAALCRSKRATYQALNGIVPVPRLWHPDDASMAFPVFVKPDRGQGGQRARRITGRDALNAALAAEPDLIVMDNLPGAEYTVDCFSQRSRGPLFARARARLQARSGVATVTRPEQCNWAQDWAEKIGRLWKMRGPWFFQVKMDAGGQPRLLEVAARISGSMAASRVTGPNFPLLALYEAAGYALSIDSFEPGLSMGRSLDIRFIYDRPIAALYMDLDDTLILRGQVNTRLIALIYQCHNRGIPVHLITRHKSDLAKTLAAYRLAHLFDRTVHIPDDATPKADFIPEPDAVLIDDSFAERQAATRLLGIRCFDAAGAVCLLDERK